MWGTTGATIPETGRWGMLLTMNLNNASTAGGAVTAFRSNILRNNSTIYIIGQDQLNHSQDIVFTGSYNALLTGGDVISVLINSTNEGAAPGAASTVVGTFGMFQLP